MFDSFAGRETSRGSWSRTIKGVGVALALALAATAMVFWPRSSAKSEPQPPIFAAITLPGMTIDAPGIVLKEGGYGKGGFHGATGGAVRPNRFEMDWHPGGGTAADDATIRTVASAMVTKVWPGTAPTLTTHALEIGGHPGMRLLARANDQTMVIALATCGDRDVSLMVHGDAAAADIADHMIASFTCTPDPSRDVFFSEVAFDVPASWQRRPHTQIIDGPGDLDVRYIAFSSEGDGSIAERVERYVPASYQLVTPATKRGDKVMWTGTRLVDAKPLPIAVLAWRCNDDHRIAMAIVESASSAPLDAGVAFAATGRCPPPDHSNQ